MHSLIETSLKVLNEILKRKEALIGIGLLALVFLGYVVGKSNCVNCVKEEVCLTYMNDNKELKKQIASLQEKKLEDKIVDLKQCKEDADKICTEKMAKYKKAYVALKCSICEKESSK